jgi:hypothetical protein
MMMKILVKNDDDAGGATLKVSKVKSGKVVRDSAILLEPKEKATIFVDANTSLKFSDK